MDLYERGLERFKDQENITEKEIIEYYERVMESMRSRIGELTHRISEGKRENKQLKNNIKVLYKYTNVRITDLNYVRIATYKNVNELLEQICNHEGKKFTLDNGYKVKTDSLRYHTFYNKGLKCVCCGIKGSFLALERSITSDNETYHLNLYAKDKKGKEVLMTKDHIHPKSLGGLDELDNMQTMCKTCNELKGNQVEI